LFNDLIKDCLEAEQSATLPPISHLDCFPVDLDWLGLTNNEGLGIVVRLLFLISARAVFVDSSILKLAHICTVSPATLRFAKRGSDPKCDDVPTPAIYEKCFNTLSENTLILTTALLLLSLIAAGVKIAHVSSASMLARSALKLIENDSRNTPVNQWTSMSPIIQSIIPNAIIYWTPHIVYYM
jgi:hypothetical protein